jgi:hypothetical protein
MLAAGEEQMESDESPKVSWHREHISFMVPHIFRDPLNSYTVLLYLIVILHSLSFTGVLEARNTVTIAQLRAVAPSRAPDVILKGFVHVLTSRLFVKKTIHIIVKN